MNRAFRFPRNVEPDNLKGLALSKLDSLPFTRKGREKQSAVFSVDKKETLVPL
jgi:hypothetical protein